MTSRILKFPFKQLPDKKDQVRANRIVWGLVIITLVPSLYFGYDIVQQNKFKKMANQFIKNEAIFPNDYLLQKNIDAKKKTITLTYGGQIIEPMEIAKLKSKLPKYGIDTGCLEIRQGFAYIKDEKAKEQSNQLTQLLINNTQLLINKENQIKYLQSRIDSSSFRNTLSNQIYKELKVQFPHIESSILQTAIYYTDSTQRTTWVSIIHSKAKWNKTDKTKIENWLKVRMNTPAINVYFE